MKLVAVALAAVAARSLAEDVDIMATLGLDDECPTFGEEGARCALNALQLRARKAATSAEDEDKKDEWSTGGYHASVSGHRGPWGGGGYHYNAGGYHASPWGGSYHHSSGGGFHSPYLAEEGEQEAAATDAEDSRAVDEDKKDEWSTGGYHASVSGHRGPWGGGGYHYNAGGYHASPWGGSYHHSSGGGFHSPYLAEEGEAVAGACTTGMVAQIHAMAPACLDACPQMCGPLGEAITAFLGHPKEGAAAAKPIVCKSATAFMCAINDENLPKCKALITQAKNFGFVLPQNPEDVEKECKM